MNQQLDLLLKIQSIEVKIADLESEKKRLPIRKQISEIVSDANSLQEVYTRTEGHVEKVENDIAELQKQYAQYVKKLESAEKRLEELSDDAPVADIDKIMSMVVSVRKSAEKRGAEITKMKQTLAKAAKMASEIGKSIIQKRKAYDELKPEYDKLVSEIDGKIKEQQGDISEIEKNVESAYLKRYKSAHAKLNKPPLYELASGSCRCCNMAISNIVKKKAGADIFVECENCGALLYIAE